jgi:hypothetical protein
MSDRLVLRRVVPDESAVYTRLHANPTVAEHLYPEGRQRSPEETNAWMEYTLASYDRLDWSRSLTLLPLSYLSNSRGTRRFR